MRLVRWYWRIGIASPGLTPWERLAVAINRARSEALHGGVLPDIERAGLEGWLAARGWSNDEGPLSMDGASGRDRWERGLREGWWPLREALAFEPVGYEPMPVQSLVGERPSPEELAVEVEEHLTQQQIERQEEP